MVAVELVAFPMLLVTSCVVFTLGRRRDRPTPGGFDAARIVFQGALFGVVAAVGVRLVAADALQMPLGLWAPVLALTGITGLITADVVDVALRRQHAAGPTPRMRRM